MAQVERMCAFQLFADGEKAYGPMRYDIGRAHNHSVCTVAIPMSFVVEYNRAVPGVVSFYLKFPTIRFNGKYGTPTLPQIEDSHKLKDARYTDRVVQYVKHNLPNTHALAQNGWTALPSLRWEPALPPHEVERAVLRVAAVAQDALHLVLLVAPLRIIPAQHHRAARIHARQ